MDSVKYKTYFRQTLPFEHEFSIYLRTCRLGKKSWLAKSDIEKNFFTRFQFQPMSKSIKKQNMAYFCGCRHFTAKYFSKWIISYPLNYSYFVSSRHFRHFLFLFGSNVCPQITKTSLNLSKSWQMHCDMHIFSYLKNLIWKIFDIKRFYFSHWNDDVVYVR